MLIKMQKNMVWSGCLAILLFSGQVLSAQDLPPEKSLREQFLQISSFDQLQNPQQKEIDADAAKVAAFFDSLAGSDEFCESTAKAWTGFFELTFARDADENFARRLQILQKAGEKQSAAIAPEEPAHGSRLFTEHVKEAIKVNSARKDYYSRVSNGATRNVSLLYTSLEYSLLPITAFFDRWAQKFNQAGIPVLQNDFVSMDDIAPAEKQPLRRGLLDRSGRKQLRKMLRSWQWKSGLAVSRKDFLQVQLLAMNMLHELRQLELRYQCHLALALHFVESVGLAARNADRLSHQFARRTDNFYRAFIAIQISGVRLFSKVDVMAQPFHRAGIGIIVNDLPAIPFP
ncbi:MAG: hypothetical protein A2W80_01875 [Candidatus Riflebacteria bacterium GWC2_50_8]|nr:MAG: hypothetical protein A2W80_01875 [Candidatus Riflebacteria bacterium GWC2_50_8]